MIYVVAAASIAAALGLGACTKVSPAPIASLNPEQAVQVAPLAEGERQPHFGSATQPAAPVAVQPPSTVAVSQRRGPPTVADYAPKGIDQVSVLQTFDGDPARFRANADGTVSDQVLNLQWQQADSRQELTWAGAQAYCRSLRLAGAGPWRLPTIEELTSLIDDRQPGRRKVAAPFRDSKPWYWSGTAWNSGASHWDVYFNDGNGANNHNSNNYLARCVR